VKAYFSDPHSPWQGGSIENANGVLHRSLPRKEKLSNGSPQDIDDIVWTYNSPP
jgi:IS30 family transposase